MKTPDGLTVVPVTHQEVLALLKSDTHMAVEQEIATRCNMKILYDYESASLSSIQSDISVSGLSASQMEDYLLNNKDSIIEFAVRFQHDQDATSDEEEYPEGEEQDPDGESETLGYGTGFAVGYAIYHNFLANLPSELKAYLKNRRIPKHTKFAKTLTRLFDETSK